MFHNLILRFAKDFMVAATLDFTPCITFIIIVFFSGLIFFFPISFFQSVEAKSVLEWAWWFCPQMAAYEGVFNVRQQFGCREGMRPRRSAPWYHQQLGVITAKLTPAKRAGSGTLTCLATPWNIFSIAKLTTSGFRGQLWSAAEFMCQGSFLWFSDTI